MAYNSSFGGKLTIEPTVSVHDAQGINGRIREELETKSFNFYVVSGRSALQCDGGFAAYDLEECLPLVIGWLRDLGYQVDGDMIWQGEEAGDVRTIRVKANEMRLIKWGPLEEGA